MVIKQILEGARRFKPTLNNQPAGQRRSFWRWPDWLHWFVSRKDEYLIDIRPRRLPRV